MLPVIAMAQQPALYDSFPYRARQFFHMDIGWPLVSLILVSVGTLFALIIIRKKYKQTKVSWVILSMFLAFGVWYFYPVFMFKGTYTATLGWPWEGEVATDVIDETYRLCGEDDEHPDVELSYHLKPLQRMLWVELPDPLPETPYIPIKLGWNKLHRPVFKSGWTEFKKTDKRRGHE